MTDYELEYQQTEAACGDPFPEFVELFSALPAASTVLDLGAGQGRDTLVAARLGHKVVAVDVSPTGIRQILVATRRESLSVEGVVCDLTEYHPNGTFDVVMLDRIVHMFRDVKDKVMLLSKAAQATADNGYVLVADTPGNQEYIERQFDDREVWMLVAAKKDARFSGGYPVPSNKSIKFVPSLRLPPNACYVRATLLRRYACWIFIPTSIRLCRTRIISTVSDSR